MNAIEVIHNTFKKTEVRAFEESGTAWFVAKDISDALGYRDAANMVRMLDDDEKGTHLVSIRSENDVEQSRSVNTINESGMYHALIKSRKPEAKPFRKWVTGEVLPSIRKTGSYTLPQTITPAQQKQLSDAITQIVIANYGKSRSERSKGFHNEWGQLKTAFKVAKYDQIALSDFPKAMKFVIGEWVPEEVVAAIPDDTILVSKINHEASKQLVVMLAEAQEDYAVMMAQAELAEDAAIAVKTRLRTFKTKTIDIVKDLTM
ncbi:MAG: BRO family protein, partial [Ghiorsea sp.]